MKFLINWTHIAGLGSAWGTQRWSYSFWYLIITYMFLLHCSISLISIWFRCWCSVSWGQQWVHSHFVSESHHKFSCTFFLWVANSSQSIFVGWTNHAYHSQRCYPNDIAIITIILNQSSKKPTNLLYKFHPCISWALRTVLQGPWSWASIYEIQAS